MNKEKEQWMEEVFQSMKGSQRATPRPELFAKIETKITGLETKVVSLYQWKSAAAIAVLILFLNVTTLLYYHQNALVSYEETVDLEAYNQSFISTYQIYE